MVSASLLVVVSCLQVLVPDTAYGDRDASKGILLSVGKLIIDTDAGSDDAIAILLALGQNRTRVDTVAITCVNGNTQVDNVVGNVFKTLHTVQRLDIPVFRGTSRSILVTPPTDDYFGKDGFGDFEFKNAPDADKLVQKEHAVNALIRMVAQSPGNVTLLCLGPLTNVALAIRMDPQFVSNLQHLVVLGGTVEGLGNVHPGLEFNFHMDPEAAFIVFSAMKHGKPLVLVPWDTVHKRTALSIKWRKETLGALASPQLKLMDRAEHLQLEGQTHWVSADPVAAAVALDPTIVLASASHHAFVEVHGGMSRGAVFVDHNNRRDLSHNVVIVQEVDMSRYKALLLANLARRSR